MSGAGALSLPVLQIALYEGRGAEPIDAGRRFALIGALLDRGYRVTRVTDGAAARADDGNALAVLGCFTDDQPADALGTDGGGRVWFRDIGDATPTRSSRRSRRSAPNATRASLATGSRGSPSSTSTAAPTACSASASASSTSTA